MGRIGDGLRGLQPYLPPLNFITVHYLYFICTTLITSVIFYCISTPAWSIPYVDCLFLQVSAITEAGLNTYNLSQMNTVQQVMLFAQIILGSAIFVSMFVVQVRRRAFEKSFGDILKRQKEQRRERRISDGTARLQAGSRNTAQRPLEDIRSEIRGAASSNVDTPDDVAVYDDPEPSRRLSATETATERGSDHITFADTEKRTDGHPDSGLKQRRHSHLFSFTGVGASPVGTTSFRRPGQHNPNPSTTISREPRVESMPSAQPDWREILSRAEVGRNSQVHGLTREEREHLGGVEYRAVTLLSWIVPLYFVLWQLLGCLGVGAWMAYNARDITEINGINPWWNGAFNAVSAFNNSGMSLLDLNMMPFQTSTYPVITMGLLILAGNTAYPVFLRFVLWVMLKLLPDKPKYRDHRETLNFVLDHPRRVYTNLFPSRPTWWLLLTIIFLNSTDWVFFELLNIGNAVVESIPTGSRILDGLFQALAVRSGGFYIVPIAQIRIGVQVLYVVMMYISVYPVAITTRSSNVYEERSLGIYAEDATSEASANDPEAAVSGRIARLRRSVTGKSIAPSETRMYFVRQQMRGQLEHDLSWLVVAVFIITCIETSSFERDPVTYSVFNIVFEVVSGYGCVGISTGLTDQAYSFSGGWHKVSKLVLVAVMLRGRHRGLPVALDRAVLLPGEEEHRREEDDGALRRATSRGRSGSGVERGREKAI